MHQTPALVKPTNTRLLQLLPTHVQTAMPTVLLVLIILELALVAWLPFLGTLQPLASAAATLLLRHSSTMVLPAPLSQTAPPLASTIQATTLVLIV